MDHRASDAPARQYFDTLSSRYWFVCRTGDVPLRAETAPDLFGSACAGKRARQQFPPEKPSFEFRGRTAGVCREERASTPGRRSRSVRHATGESIPSVYRLLLLLHVRGQGRRNERRRRFFARAAVQPSAVREAESAELLLSDGRNGLPTSSTSLLPDNVQHRTVGVFPGVARSSTSKGARC